MHELNLGGGVARLGVKPHVKNGISAVAALESRDPCGKNSRCIIPIHFIRSTLGVESYLSGEGTRTRHRCISFAYGSVSA